MNLIVLSMGFPNKDNDNFLFNEINELSKCFERIYIIPVLGRRLLAVNRHTTVPSCELPANVEVVDVMYSWRDLVWMDSGMFKAIVQSFTFNFQKAAIQFRAVLNSNLLVCNINRLVRNKKLPMENTVLYSYWFHYCALAVGRAKGNFRLRVCRAHGYDLYEERGIQPYKPFILKHLDFVFPCSEVGTRYIKSLYGNPENVVTKYLGSINTNEAKIKMESDDTLHLVSCSEVVKVKRVELIIDALAEVKDVKIEWVHFGGGLEFNAITVHAQEKLKNHKNITYRFEGMVNNKLVHAYYRDKNVDCLLNVSESEGLPVSMMEALSWGIPVIGTDVGGVRELIEDKVNGFLIPGNFKSETLAALLVSFQRMMPSEREAMRHRARLVWEDRFNAQHNYKQFAFELTHAAEGQA